MTLLPFPNSVTISDYNCIILKVNGPVAALVAETDYTYLAFGAGAVVVVFAATLVGVVICRSSCLFAMAGKSEL